MPNPYAMPATFYTYDTVANPRNTFTLLDPVALEKLLGRAEVSVIGNITAKMMLANGKEISIVDPFGGFYSDSQMRLLRYTRKRKNTEVVIDEAVEAGEDI